LRIGGQASLTMAEGTVHARIVYEAQRCHLGAVERQNVLRGHVDDIGIPLERQPVAGGCSGWCQCRGRIDEINEIETEQRRIRRHRDDPGGGLPGRHHAADGDFDTVSCGPGDDVDRGPGSQALGCWGAMALVTGEGISPGDGVGVVRSDGHEGRTLVVLAGEVAGGDVRHQGLHTAREDLGRPVGHDLVDQETPRFTGSRGATELGAGELAVVDSPVVDRLVVEVAVVAGDDALHVTGRTVNVVRMNRMFHDRDIRGVTLEAVSGDRSIEHGGGFFSRDAMDVTQSMTVAAAESPVNVCHADCGLGSQTAMAALAGIVGNSGPDGRALSGRRVAMAVTADRVARPRINKAASGWIAIPRTVVRTVMTVDAGQISVRDINIIAETGLEGCRSYFVDTVIVEGLLAGPGPGEAVGEPAEPFHLVNAQGTNVLIDHVDVVCPPFEEYAVTGRGVAVVERRTGVDQIDEIEVEGSAVIRGDWDDTLWCLPALGTEI